MTTLESDTDVMSLKRNILANYASQIYVTLIGIVMVPLYLKYMGAEAYGLVGFFAMLQAWFNLLDMGLTPTMARETARFRGGAMDAITFRRLVRALEGIFLAVALFGGGALLAVSGRMAKNWLTAQQLPISEVHIAIQLMAVSVSLRWMSGLYRGQISGAERLVLLSGYNAAIATIRFVGVLAVLMLVSITPAAFFSYQLGAAIIELAGLMVIAYRLLPLVPQGERLSWSWTPVKPVLKFSLTIALTSSAWVLVTQTDKLVLSKILPLAEYGYFTLAVLVASGVMIISGPVSGAIMPRMAKLNAEGNETELIRLYRNASQLVGVIAIPAALVLAFFSEQLLWAWTGNAEIVRKAAPVLTLYALGNAILALGAFPFYLQYAKGDLKIHLIGTAVFIAMLLPGLFWAASHYGINGPGYAWFGTNIVFFLLWPPIVHRRFGKVLHTQWLRDLGGIVSLTVVGAISLLAVVSWPEGRASVAMKLAMISLLLLVLAASGSSLVRETINLRWCALFPRGIGRQ